MEQNDIFETPCTNKCIFDTSIQQKGIFETQPIKNGIFNNQTHFGKLLHFPSPLSPLPPYNHSHHSQSHQLSHVFGPTEDRVIH